MSKLQDLVNFLIKNKIKCPIVFDPILSQLMADFFIKKVTIKLLQNFYQL